LNDTPPTTLSTLSLHDALPIYIAYNSFNLPTTITLGTGSQVHYQYDASESRVLVDVGDCSDENSSQCNRRVYVGDAYERQKATEDRKSTRLNSSHLGISYAVFC